MTKTISISGEKFEVSEPYAEGHLISAIEAKVLNQTRAENIGNNFRSEVKEALTNGHDLTEVRGKLAEYDGQYTFSMGGSTRQPVDPVEREARKIARDAIKAQLASEGRKISEIDKERLEAAIDQVAVQDDVLKLAKKRVADLKRNVAAVALGDLGLVSADSPTA